MLPGTIVMLAFIIVVIYGGSGWLMKLNLQSSRRRSLQESGPGNETVQERK